MENNGLYPIISVKLAAHKTPEFKEEKQKDWVIYGTDREPIKSLGGKSFYNNYGGYLDYLCNRSSKQNAFINGKVHYICGNGWDFDRTGLTLAQITEAHNFLNESNENGDDLSEETYKIVQDIERYGGAYIEIVYKKSGNDFAHAHMSWNSLRLSKDGKGFWYSKDWTKPKQSKEDTDLEYIPKYDPEKKQARSILYYYEYRPDLQYYPLPNYIASAVYAEIDVEMSNYRLNAIKSGFNAGTILNFNNGKPQEGEKEVVEGKVKEKFEGTDRANSLLITFNANKDSAPTIEHLTPQNVDEQLNALNEQVMQELIVGHRIPNPILVGIKTSGELGASNEVADSFELWKNGYIKPKQRVIEKFFNFLLEQKGFKHRLFLKEVRPADERPTPEQKFEVMTEEEKREWAGLPPLPEKPKQVVSSTVHRFNSDCCDHHFSEEEDDIAERDIEVFRQFGEDLDGYELMHRKYVFGEVDEDKMFEDEIKNYSFDILEGDVKLLYRNILDLLNKDPLMPNEVIAKTLKTSLNRINVAVARLVSDGAISVGQKVSGDEKSETRTPTKEADKVLNKQGSSVGELKIMYTYEPRPGLRPVIENTRPFCRKLMESKKLFTRQQIENVSRIVGYDVWTKRGGWWTQKGGAVTTPFCRHVWVQNVVRKK